MLLITFLETMEYRIYQEEKAQKHYQVNFFTFSKQIYDYINTQFYLNLIFL